MPLSTLTAFSGVTDKAPISPSYVNSKFSVLVQNLNQLNTDVFSVVTGGFYSIRAFGALGDNVTDDSSALSTALSTMNAAGGGTLYFSAGTYFVNTAQDSISAFTLPSNIALLGSPSAAIRAGSNLRGKHIFNTNAASNVRVRWLGFQNESSARTPLNETSDANAFHFVGGSNIQIEGCRFQRLSYGVYERGATDVWFHHNEVDQCYIGFFASGGDLASQTSHILVEGNHAWNCGWTPLGAEYGVRYIEFANNICHNNGNQGIAVSTVISASTDMSSHVRIVNNLCFDNTFESIKVSGGVADAYVAGNDCDACIYMPHGGSVVAIGNTADSIVRTGDPALGYSPLETVISGNRVRSIAISSCSSDVAITGNYVFGPGTAGASKESRFGIRVEGNTNNVMINVSIIGNSIGSITQGLAAFGQAIWADAFNLLTVRDNDIRNCQSGISVGATSGRQLILENNSLTSISGTTLQIPSALTATIRNNVGYDAVSSVFTLGTVLLPGMAFSSETSLGWYRSAASNMALSYGTLNIPGNLQVGGGSSTYTLGVGSFNNGALRAPSDIGAATIIGVAAGGSQGVGNGAVAHLGSFANRGGVYLRSYQSAVGLEHTDFVINQNRDGSANAPETLRILGANGAMLASSGAALAPTYAFSAESMLGFYRSGVSTIAPSYGTVNFATSGVRLSMRTLAASAVTLSAANTNTAINEVVFTIGGASGASLVVNSGGTSYIFNSAMSAKNT